MPDALLAAGCLPAACARLRVRSFSAVRVCAELSRVERATRQPLAADCAVQRAPAQYAGPNAQLLGNSQRLNGYNQLEEECGK